MLDSIKKFFGFGGGNPTPMVANTVAGDNLVAWWKCDDDAASTVVLDSSGNGYNGESVRNTNLMHVAGKIDGALKFENIEEQEPIDFIDSGQTFQTTFRNNFTISLWIKINQFPQNSYYLFGHDRENEAFIFRITSFINSNGQLAFDYGWQDGHSISMTSEEDILTSILSKWTLFSFTVEENSGLITSKKYINSILKEFNYRNGNMLNYTPTINFIIGDNIDQDGAFLLGLKGSLDDIRIYNKALSADEIKQLYDEAGGVNFSPRGMNFLINHY